MTSILWVAPSVAGVRPTPDIPDIVVLDTCVLISNVLRKALLLLADQGCFVPVWSDRIGVEWRRNAARIWGVSVESINEQWEALEQAFPEANQGDVSPCEAGLHRSDPKDWHVIAAGRSAKNRMPGRKAAILTRNIKDFNRTELRGYGMTLFDPDDFLVRVHAVFPDRLRRVVAQIPTLAAADGADPEPLDTILKRERLFRLNRLYRSTP